LLPFLILKGFFKKRLIFIEDTLPIMDNPYTFFIHNILHHGFFVALFLDQITPIAQFKRKGRISKYSLFIRFYFILFMTTLSLYVFVSNGYAFIGLMMLQSMHAI
jgi:hypothetical protein